MKLIIYGSEYGTTQHYAEKLSEVTSIQVINYTEVKDLSQYQTIIYMGGLYAGGVKGLKQTVKLLSSSTNLMIITVGLADVHDKDNTDHIKKSIQQQIPKDIYNRSKIFHLRGGINYQKLNFKHKTMMSLLYQKAKRIPKEQQTADVKAMIETYNQEVYFINDNDLDPIIKAIGEQNHE